MILCALRISTDVNFAGVHSLPSGFDLHDCIAMLAVMIRNAKANTDMSGRTLSHSFGIIGWAWVAASDSAPPKQALTVKATAWNDIGIGDAEDSIMLTMGAPELSNSGKARIADAKLTQIGPHSIDIDYRLRDASQSKLIGHFVTVQRRIDVRFELTGLPARGSTRRMTEDWRHRHNHHRPHRSLGGSPPVRFAMAQSPTTSTSE